MNSLLAEIGMCVASQWEGLRFDSTVAWNKMKLNIA